MDLGILVTLMKFGHITWQMQMILFEIKKNQFIYLKLFVMKISHVNKRETTV